MQDTGQIAGIAQAAQSTSYAAMALHQQALGDAILKDSDVASLSSTIGIDGTNTTLNAGRFLINLVPKSQRSQSASEIIRRLNAARLPMCPGIAAVHAAGAEPDAEYDGFSPTLYQFVLEDPNEDDFTKYVPAADDEIAGAAAAGGCGERAAGEPGNPSYIDHQPRPMRRGSALPRRRWTSALYDAFGQRIISTIFTQTDQYRVIMTGRSGED